MPNAQGLLLINIIKDDIAMMEYAIKNGYTRNAAYQVQQVLEKSLKLVLMSHGATDNSLKLHDISALINMVASLGLQVPNELYTVANKITAWEANARYDEIFIVTSSDVKGCATIVKRYFNLVTSRL